MGEGVKVGGGVNGRRCECELEAVDGNQRSSGEALSAHQERHSELIRRGTQRSSGEALTAASTLLSSFIAWRSSSTDHSRYLVRCVSVTVFG